MHTRILSDSERFQIISESQKVKKSDIDRKKSILSDFGISQTALDSLFTDKEFSCLRALDCFTDSVIRNQLNGKEFAAM